MIKQLLVGWLLLGVLLAWVPPQPDPHSLRSVTAVMAQPGVAVTVIQGECGVANAGYDPENHVIVICDELVTEFGLTSGAIRAIYAHEFAHAVIDQLDIPVTGSEERAADDLMALSLTRAGMKADLISLMMFYYTHDEPEDPEDVDGHPSDMARAVRIAYIVNQLPPVYPLVERAWDRLLKDYARITSCYRLGV